MLASFLFPLLFYFVDEDTKAQGGELTWPKSHRQLGKVRIGNTMCAFFHIYKRLKTRKTVIFICILFQFFSSVSFFPCYLLTQISQLLTQTILEIRRHSFNANNAFLKEVVSTHNIFMLSDLMPTIYIHGWMGISGSIWHGFLWNNFHI